MARMNLLKSTYLHNGIVSGCVYMAVGKLGCRVSKSLNLFFSDGLDWENLGDKHFRKLLDITLL